MDKVILDDVDLTILKILQSNCKKTVRDIAQEIHLSVSPIHNRIKRLEESGVISAYEAKIEYSKIRKSLTVICYVSLKEHNKTSGAQFIETIKSFPEITECYNISGEFDFMFKVVCHDMESYYNFHVNKLSQTENIGHVQSIFVLSTIKQTQPLIEFSKK